MCYNNDKVSDINHRGILFYYDFKSWHNKIYDVIIHNTFAFKKAFLEGGMFMTNVGRKLGVNIFTLMQNSGISREVLAEKLNYTYRDMCRILEGKLMLTPDEIERIAGFFEKTKKELLDYESDNLVPELQYMKEFSDINNLNMILNLLDDYVELKESV